MSPLIYCLSKSTLSGPISSLYEKNNPPVSEERDSEISNIWLWLLFSYASESLFKTLKYVPIYPTKPFDSVIEARKWVSIFCRWYNYSHRHSGLKFVTPTQRHRGKDKGILEERKHVYEAARRKHPERWSGKIRNWDHETVVELNPANQALEKKEDKIAA